MNHNQKVAFWSMFVMFCVVGTLSIFLQGAFDNLTFAGSALLLVFYLIVAMVIRFYVKANRKQIDQWFKK